MTDTPDGGQAFPNTWQPIETESLFEQIDALLELDAKGQLVPHGVGGLARELLIVCRGQIEIMRQENARLWSVLTLSDAETRQWFIGDLVRKSGHLNRADICNAFNVSVPQASYDIRKWLADNPGKISYNPSTKRYERLMKEAA